MSDIPCLSASSYSRVEINFIELNFSESHVFVSYDVKSLRALFRSIFTRAVT